MAFKFRQLYVYSFYEYLQNGKMGFVHIKVGNPLNIDACVFSPQVLRMLSTTR